LIAALGNYLIVDSRGEAGPTRDTTAERAAFLARKADLFARIAAAQPGLIPPSPTNGAPTDGDPT
jgi:hypothetical protein